MTDSKPTVADPAQDATHRIKVKGAADFVSGNNSKIELALTPTQLLLVGYAPGQEPRVLDVLKARPLTYHAKMLGDHITIGEHDVSIPAGKGAEAQRMIALARLRQQSDQPRALSVTTTPLSDDLGPVYHEWLRGWLRDNEHLIAWLETGTETRVESDVMGTRDVACAFVLTSARCALVAISPVGDVRLALLAQESLVVKDGIGRAQISCGKHKWHTTIGNAGAYRQLALLTATDPDEREMATARTVWLSGAKAEGKAWVESLLQQRTKDGDAWARLTLAVLLADRPLSVGLLRPVAADEAPTAKLVSWIEEWHIDGPVVRSLATGFRHVGARRCAAALHEHWWRNVGRHGQGPMQLAELASGLAVDLTAAGRYDDAGKVLRQALEGLPDPTLQELVAHTGTPPAGGVLQMRARLLDGLLVIRQRTDKPLTPIVAELAGCFPLSRTRLKALAATEGAVQERARTLLRCLAPGGLHSKGGEPDSSSELDGKLDWQQLLHPLAHNQGPLAALAGLVRGIAPFDATDARSYCESAPRQQHLGIQAALERAHTVLQPEAEMEVLLARGDRAVGVRGFGGQRPFILLGAAHVDNTHAAYLQSPELAHALAAQMALVHAGYSTVTSHPAWEAVAADGNHNDAVAAAFPALASQPFGSFVEALFDDNDTSSEPTTAPLWVSRRGDALLDPDLAINPDATAAGRVMLFTADRCGLVASGGNLAASLRAVLKTTPRLHHRLEDIFAAGLSTVLEERNEDGSLREPQLTSRLGALNHRS